MSNSITQLVLDYLSQNDPGTNKYFVKVTFQSPYIPGTHQYGDEFGWPIQGDRVPGKSPDFRFVPPGMKVIPPEAYNVDIDWVGVWLTFPVVGQGVMWVEYCEYSRSFPTTDSDDLTVNGAIGSSEWWGRTSGVLYLIPDFISTAGRISTAGPSNVIASGFSFTLTFWYDEAHTNNGTRWTWTSANGCVKTEIYPPTPTLASAVVPNGIQLTLTGGSPYQIYVLEGKETVDGKWTPFALVLTDDKGKAGWLSGVGAGNRFVRARLPEGGEFPPKQLVIFPDNGNVNLFMFVPMKDTGHFFFVLEGSRGPSGPFQPVPTSVGGGQKVFLPNLPALAVWRVSPNPLKFFRVVTH